MKPVLISIFLTLLLGCASKSVTLTDVSEAMENNNTQSLDGQHKFRLDYLIKDKAYVYLTFEIDKQHRFLQVLVENNQIIAVSEIPPSDYYSPEIRRCTLFPLHKELNIETCLSEFNLAVLRSNDFDLLSTLATENLDEKNRATNNTVGTIALVTILSPLIVPAAIVQSPLLVYDYNSDQNRKEQFTMALGANDRLPQYLKSFESDYLSIHENSGTAYLEAGIMNEPAVAFGFIENTIIWIQKDPIWTCGGGFMFWGLKCTVGRHSDRHW